MWVRVFADETWHHVSSLKDVIAYCGNVLINVAETQEFAPFANLCQNCVYDDIRTKFDKQANRIRPIDRAGVSKPCKERGQPMVGSKKSQAGRSVDASSPDSIPAAIFGKPRDW